MTYAHAGTLLRRRSHQRGACRYCDTHTLPQTALEAIRRYEHIGRIPWGQRLDVQPCELAS